MANLQEANPFADCFADRVAAARRRSYRDSLQEFRILVKSIFGSLGL
jgi:hypothetical protein